MKTGACRIVAVFIANPVVAERQAVTKSSKAWYDDPKYKDGRSVFGNSSRICIEVTKRIRSFSISVLSTYDVENMLIAFMAIMTGFLVLALIVIVVIRIHYKAKADEMIHDMEIQHQAKKTSKRLEALVNSGKIHRKWMGASTRRIQSLGQFTLDACFDARPPVRHFHSGWACALTDLHGRSLTNGCMRLTRVEHMNLVPY